ncbi:MAG: flagellar hook-length control protein FliK [candidate division KSB1 bacterium]|nr:flagellar hook-length control protein FliK [candidate division KSB1 bacterium]
MATNFIMFLNSNYRNNSMLGGFMESNKDIARVLRGAELAGEDSMEFQSLLQNRVQGPKRTATFWGDKDTDERQEAFLPIIMAASLANALPIGEPVDIGDANSMNGEQNLPNASFRNEKNSQVGNQKASQISFALLTEVSTALKNMTNQWNLDETALGDAPLLSINDLKNVVLAARNHPDFSANFVNQVSIKASLQGVFPEALTEKLQLHHGAEPIKPKPILVALQAENLQSQYRLYPALLWRKESSNAFAAIDAKTPLLTTQIIGPNGFQDISNEIIIISSQSPVFEKLTVYEGNLTPHIPKEVNLEWIEITFQQDEVKLQTPFQNSVAKPVHASLVSSRKEFQTWQNLLAEWNQSLRQIFAEQYKNEAQDLNHSTGEETKYVHHKDIARNIHTPSPNLKTWSFASIILDQAGREKNFRERQGYQTPAGGALRSEKLDHLMQLRSAGKASNKMPLFPIDENQDQSKPLANKENFSTPSHDAKETGAKTNYMIQRHKGKVEYPELQKEANYVPRPESSSIAFGPFQRKSFGWDGRMPGPTKVREAERVFLQQERKLTFENLKQQIRSQITQDMSTIRIRLKPEKLGQISMKLEMQAGQLSAKIWVETKAVKQLLESNLDHLRETLFEKGVKAERLEIRLAPLPANANKDEGAQPKFEHPSDQHRHSKSDQNNSGSRKRQERNKPDFRHFL